MDTQRTMPLVALILYQSSHTVWHYDESPVIQYGIMMKIQLYSVVLW